jgi:Autographiviridae endonuclease VII
VSAASSPRSVHRREATGIAYLKALVMDQEDAKEKQRRQQREAMARRRADPVFREKERRADRARIAANRDERNAEWRRKYANDEEFRAKHNASGFTSRRKRTLKKHGLSLEDYEAMLARQQGACGICEIPFRRTPCIDHCHVTGLVRGLLCNNCNLAIGNLQDNPIFAYKAGGYLERWVRYLWQLYNKKENDMSSIEDASDRSKAAALIRNAILHELRQPHAIELPPPADKLQAIVRALVARAEGAQDLSVVKEVFDRVGGGTSPAPRADQWPLPINLPWKQTEPRANPSAPAPATTPARAPSRAKSGRTSAPRS